MQFKNVYSDRTRMKVDRRQPSLLAICDSWFWYPFPDGSLLNQPRSLVEKRDHVIFAQGSNAAEAYEYAFGRFTRQIRTVLKLYGNRLSAVLISAGGNDFAGLKDLRLMLLGDCSGCTSAAACFRRDTKKGSLGWLLDKMVQSYTSLVDRIIGATLGHNRQRWRRQPAGERDGADKIVVHNYDCVPVTGIGPYGDKPPWLKIALDAAQVAPHLHGDCIRLLVERFADMLDSLAVHYPRRAYVVDSCGALARLDWANEMHPTQEGFAKTAPRWHQVLQPLELSP